MFSIEKAAAAALNLLQYEKKEPFQGDTLMMIQEVSRGPVNSIRKLGRKSRLVAERFDHESPSFLRIERVQGRRQSEIRVPRTKSASGMTTFKFA